MRSKKAAYNFAAALIELAVVTIASFVVPRYIISAFGSEVNGLVGSIKQFLSYIALVESGIGAIGRASLYKPLADNDRDTISGNFRAIEGFYRKVAYLFLGYVAVLSVLYPLLVNKEFDKLYTAVLLCILAISTFIQYYYGITNQTLVQSDQRKYITSLLRSLTVALNMVFTIIFVRLHASIHVVKLGSALAYTVRPIILYFYCKKRYGVNRKAQPNKIILKQRWDGLAQHIAFFIHKNTDIAVLTVLANMKEVSVYSVYMLAVSGCSKIINIISSSLEPAFGNMIAKGEKDVLEKRVSLCSILVYQSTVILFTAAAFVISPFITIYTRGVTDVNYMRPAFGIIMLLAEAVYCIRMPFQSAVYAAGHFRQTRNGAIAEAVLNIVISVVLVFKFGLIGVAIGTLVSMTVRTAQYIWYYHKKLLGTGSGFAGEIKKLIISAAEIAVFYGAFSLLPAYNPPGYIKWFAYSLGIGLMCLAIGAVFSLVFYRKEVRDLLGIVKHLLSRMKPSKTGAEKSES